MASIGRYSGAALATMEKVKGETAIYTPNKLYFNAIHNIYWFINQNGYLHVLRPCEVRLDGKLLHYCVEDSLLTKDNMLQYKNSYGEFKTVEKAIEELKNRSR